VTLSSFPQSSGAITEMAPDTAINAEGLTKWFSATQALDGVTFSIRRGEIHALVGENGAGKSTLLGILSGRVVPTRGELRVFGQPFQFGNPRASRQLGIATIYQELTMIPALSAEANVFLGQETGQGLFLSKRMMQQRFQQLCQDLEVEIDGRRLARELPIAQQQILEIMRGVAAQARIMLFDEPTAALPEHEREAALRLIHRLSTHGVTVIFVSHHLDEVLQISDRTTVLRNGRLIDTKPTKEWTEKDLVQKMLGREVQPAKKRSHPISQNLILRAEGVTVPGAIQDISVDVHAGEIVGLGGLVGSGRTTLLRSLAGLEPSSHGRLWIEGKEVPWPHTPRTSHQYGIALVPEDRKRQGLILGMSVANNVTLTFLEAVSRFGFISSRKQWAVVAGLIKNFSVPTSVIPLRASSLSGGNQQRILIAKWLHRRPRILLADEPTRGIDVGAKAEVLERLQHFAEDGMAILMTSSDLEEVLAVSDRVEVLAEGQFVQELDNVIGQLSVSDVLTRAFRLNDEEQ
jgi:ABC-type sugar transport system ATPase subunit